MSTLTKTEKFILIQKALGESSKEIAAFMGRSVRTVEAHSNNIMTKLGARNFIEAYTMYLLNCKETKQTVSKVLNNVHAHHFKKVLPFIVLILSTVIINPSTNLVRTRILARRFKTEISC